MWHRALFQATLAGAIMVGLCRDAEWQDVLQYRVESDARIARSIRITTNVALTTVTVTIDGQRVDNLESDIGLRVHRENEYTVKDHLELVADGQPRKLRRSFEKVISREVIESSDESDSPESQVYASRLEGRDVVFTWDEKNQGFSASFDEDEQSTAVLISGLEEDMDMRWLLPEGEMSVGDGWKIEGTKDLLSPGGDLRVWDHDETPEEIEADDNLRRNRNTKVIATHRGAVVKDGIRLIVIGLKSESGSSTVLKDPSGSAHIEEQSKLDGQILWDSSLGRARVVSLAGDLRLTVHAKSNINQEVHEITREFTGQVAIEMSFEHE